jgi:hypothetical protein
MFEGYDLGSDIFGGTGTHMTKGHDHVSLVGKNIFTPSYQMGKERGSLQLGITG